MNDELTTLIRRELENTQCTCKQKCWSGEMVKRCRRCEIIAAMDAIVQTPAKQEEVKK